MNLCPACKGRKGNVVLAKQTDGPCRPMQLPCYLCKGTGQVSDEQLDWIKLGQKLREDRMARDESSREAAKRLGLHPVEYSRMEHGQEDPNTLLLLQQLREQFGIPAWRRSGSNM